MLPLKKMFHILKGWGKALGILSVSVPEKKLSDLRMKICMHCFYSKGSKMLELINGHGEYVNTIYCTKCKCPCKEKSLVTDEKCPMGNW